MLTLYKYQGAGNDFLMADNRSGDIHLTPQQISQLCDRRYGVGADGLILLEKGGDDYDFRMVFYNSDGSGGVMCGNGGRCIVSFADHCGIHNFHFEGADGPHDAEILFRDGNTCFVRLRMKDVDEMRFYAERGVNGCFLDTGTRHLVCPVTLLDRHNIIAEGRRLRYLDEFAPQGVNVNFIEVLDKGLKVRTYEKGVEDETYACGTGITASAIAAWHYDNPDATYPQQPVRTPVRALRDDLIVDFTPTAEGAVDVFLTGPAAFVATITVD